MSTHNRLIRRGVVAGGSGGVGRMFVELLVGHGVEVCVLDPVAPQPFSGSTQWLCGDVTAPTTEVESQLAAADLVLLAVSESVALDAVPVLANMLAASALVGDTVSVKTRIVSAWSEHPACRQWVSLNPMFSPSLTMHGRSVAAVVSDPSPLAEELLKLVEAAGARIVRMEAERHDRLTAAAQVLTHATVLSFGAVMADLGVDIAELSRIAPPPFTTLLALLARITSGSSEVYWDIQSSNPFADNMRARLAEATERLQSLVRDGEDESFGASMCSLQRMLGDELTWYSRLCGEFFEMISNPSYRERE
ncbi:prephenate dehydrogenase dimerization domain-containing protein [Nocardia terpenica]|uniref:Prephenate dehydrogenase/arogenate dehydrogenase family protein n=1 Tax=Nocardia terpenica TaxID=455432 RepID=A0A6G9Z9W7_9NOCA|nr:prephenate dehydrogenase dimerization domain-containing protein [Nocardia terpenica]QIS22157.1 prephenate dehydrogenase/arogenate dehydrogenase family protein [Nocardia terpenica]